MRRRLAVVVLVPAVALAAVLWLPELFHDHDLKGKAAVAAMKVELRNLAESQEAYLRAHGVYAADTAALSAAGLGVTPVPGVTVRFGTVTATGWSATASHRDVANGCAIFAGTAASPVAVAPAGEARCVADTTALAARP